MASTAEGTWLEEQIERDWPADVVSSCRTVVGHVDDRRWVAVDGEAERLASRGETVAGLASWASHAQRLGRAGERLDVSRRLAEEKGTELSYRRALQRAEAAVAACPWSPYFGEQARILREKLERCGGGPPAAPVPKEPPPTPSDVVSPVIVSAPLAASREQEDRRLPATHSPPAASSPTSPTGAKGNGVSAALECLASPWLEDLVPSSGVGPKGAQRPELQRVFRAAHEARAARGRLAAAIDRGVPAPALAELVAAARAAAETSRRAHEEVLAAARSLPPRGDASGFDESTPASIRASLIRYFGNS